MVNIKVKDGEYFIIDDKGREFQLDKDKCLIKQITDVCDKIIIKGENDNGTNKQ